MDASFDVDANGGRFHYFIDGRFFYINKENSPNCDTSKGWLRVLDGDQPCEEYAFKKERIPGIFYSTQNTATLWTKGTTGRLTRQKNWARTSGKCFTDRIILPVYTDSNLLRVNQKVTGCSYLTRAKL